MFLNNFVNGVQLQSKGTTAVPVIDPCNAFVYANINNTTREEVDEAVAVARQAYSIWSKVSRVKRAEYFDNLAQIVKRKRTASPV